MHKLNKRNKTAKKIMNFLNADIDPRHFINKRKHIVGGFVSALLVISAINIEINKPPVNNIPNSSAMEANLDVQTPQDPPMGGKIEGTGTHFEILDSQYLNITLDAANPIKVEAESVPQIFLMNIEAESSDVLSTSVTLSGFLPSTTYHKYEDGYSNHTVFVTDDSGKYTYIQDLTISHLVYFQPRPSTKTLTNLEGGDCNTIGIWTESTKTCVLTQDVTESIQINGDDITLDGNGHSVTGSNTGFGASIFYGRKNVIIKNLNISNFSYGVAVYSATGNTISDLNISNTTYGIRLFNSAGNKIERNNIKNNINGIVLFPSSNNNIIKNNEISFTRDIGLDIYSASNDNYAISNNIHDNRWGAYIRFSLNNVLDGNTMTANSTGISLGYMTTMNNRIVNNTVKDCQYNIGIRMHEGTNGNIVYNNYFNNAPFFNDATPYNNTWNIEKTLGTNIVGGPYIGGNFWGLKSGNGFSETCADTDADGICNNIYVVNFQTTPVLTDNLPLAKPDITAPVTSMNITGTAGTNSWYVSGVSITLTAEDNLNGSGVAKTEYSFDNANWIAYVSAIEYGDEGATTIYYRSRDNAGNTETAQTNLFKIDKSAPKISGAATTAPNANNWYKQDVVIRFNCNDIVSGAVKPVIDETISTEGASQSKSATCTDNAGNISELTVGDINLDKTIPIVSVLRSPDANSRGWNNTPVTVTFAATDGMSDLDGNSTNVVVFDVEGPGQTASYNFSDKAGNIATASVSRVNLDFTPPTITGDTVIAPNSNNWYNTDVSVHFTGADALSGLASISPDTTISFEGLNQEAMGTAEDYAGNIASYTVNNINIDKTAPMITGAPSITPNSNNWYNSDIIVKFTALDDLSGIAGEVPDVVVSQEGAVQSVSAVATDKAGNTANAEVTGINLDKTPPTITGVAINAPNDKGWYKDDAVIHFESVDSLSGINSVTPDITLFAEGQDLTAQGEAFDKAGNSAKFIVRGINIDKTSPVTEAILSGNSKNNLCSTKDTSIILAGSDTLSGVAGTFYNLDNAGWFSYLGQLFVAAEGQHVLKYNSQDNADNSEIALEVPFLVDKTPAEAVIKFDAQSKDIKVYNSKTGNEAPYTVISRNIADEDGKGWDLRRYKMTSCGDNYITLTLMRKKTGKEAMIKIVSLQQNSGPKVKFKSTTIKTEYSVTRSGSIKELEQRIQSEKSFDIKAKYSLEKNNSEIKLKLADQKETSESRQGIVILMLSTEKGSFKYQY